MTKSPIEIANANLAFGAYFAQTLSFLGLKKIFFSPGSRSTPLIVGIERFSEIDLVPVLDERTAGFMALGQSKRENRPVGLIQVSRFFYFQLIVLQNCRIVVQVRRLIKSTYLENLSENFISLKFLNSMKIIKIN